MLIICTHKHTSHPLRHSIQIGGSHTHILKKLLNEIQQKVHVAQKIFNTKSHYKILICEKLRNIFKAALHILVSHIESMQCYGNIVNVIKEWRDLKMLWIMFY